MTTDDKKRTLISYRMTQAKESLEQAAIFIETVEKYLIGGGWLLTPPSP